jgi:hypothetical protein
VLNSDGKQTSGTNTVGRVEMVSTSTHTTISHAPLPMIRDAGERKMEGRTEPDDDDDGDLLSTSPDQRV